MVNVMLRMMLSKDDAQMQEQRLEAAKAHKLVLVVRCGDQKNDGGNEADGKGCVAERGGYVGFESTGGDGYGRRLGEHTYQRGEHRGLG